MPARRWAFMPISWWGSFTPVVIMMPVTWRWSGLVVNPVTIAIIAIMISPPARITPSTAVPIISTIVTVTYMERQARNAHADFHIGMSKCWQTQHYSEN